ncbi:Trypanosome variant surface glycoprotein (A-type), putative [Trypanosoma equiperdum]|uniref:Trypanosome variant surface glycoprotein (A-type), putative n=1 Tax=Trypanosoma equiperdum TaxID=5694 RepID=A0A1G4I381_TRYEQ|nr:Trypanosome variant surface glycoprotein (A-type), putative [Trypanosoma equiperdum]
MMLAHVFLVSSSLLLIHGILSSLAASNEAVIKKTWQHLAKLTTKYTKIPGRALKSPGAAISCADEPTKKLLRLHVFEAEAKNEELTSFVQPVISGLAAKLNFLKQQTKTLETAVAAAFAHGYLAEFFKVFDGFKTGETKPFPFFGATSASGIEVHITAGALNNEPIATDRPNLPEEDGEAGMLGAETYKL